jgi:hypothetical protein
MDVITMLLVGVGTSVVGTAIYAALATQRRRAERVVGQVSRLAGSGLDDLDLEARKHARRLLGDAMRKEVQRRMHTN